MPHILIVCTANICRSPVGEVFLHARLQEEGLADWTVASAGTWGLDGRSASAYSVVVVAQQGLDLSGHSARMITGDMLAEADLVLCMELGHVEALKAEFPLYRNRIFLLSEMVGKRYSIQDPYGGPLEGYQRMAREVSTLIDEGLTKIIALAQTEE